MKTFIIATIGVLFAGALALAAILGVSYVKYHNLGNSTEQVIKAQYKEAQNTLSSTSTTVSDMVKVKGQYAEDLKMIVKETMAGRYGNDSEPVMKWIQEQNLQLDSKIYSDINVAIQSGRTDFKNAQSILIDKKRSYETLLGNFWSGLWLNINGYPKINLADYQIIIDQGTQERYDNGEDKGFL